MNIRFSLRLYIIGSLLFLVVSLTALYSVLAVQYFVDGLDAVTKRTMAEVGRTTELVHSGQTAVLGYHVAGRYEDVPQGIRDYITSPPATPLELHKHIIQDTMFSRPEAAYFLMLVKTEDGQPRYVSRAFQASKPAASRGSRWLNPITIIVLVAVAVVVIFLLLLLLILRSVAKPVEALRDWAKSLTPERLQQPAPVFRYRELDALAEIVRGSLLSVQRALDREHDFLRHASHELRTPIATITSNVELLRKLHPQPGEKEGRIIGRIERAGETMRHLTETLLWLSREADQSLPLEPVALDGLVDLVSQDLGYLLQGKDVTVHVQTEPAVLALPRVAVQIMLANLIRNAFQHTQEGDVWIEQQGAQVSIVNRDRTEWGGSADELGFGLGLDLTRKLAERFSWPYRNAASERGHEASVHFTGVSGSSSG